MNLTEISIEKLTVSPLNVRKSFSKSGIDEMKASILAHGLLSNLVVTEGQKGTYYVVAGARRLTALKELQKEEKLPKGHAVPCQIRQDGDSSEASLAENTVREEMHPADEYEAFAALAKELEPSEIATRFGVTERHVMQRLKLGRVAPEIMKAYRADEMNLESLMAFTLTDDQGIQRKVFKAVKQSPSAYHIRRLLTEQKVGSNDKLARFVGIDAYQKAGGTVTGDLFGKEQFLDDAALLQELAEGKLRAEGEKVKAEGWGWIETAMEDEYSFVGKYGRIHSKPIPPSKELVQKHAKMAKECEKLENQLQEMASDDPCYEDLDTKSQAMVDELEALETQMRSATYDPEEMKLAGAYVRLDYEGRLKVDRGLVSKKDQKKRTPEPGKAADEPKEKGMSQSLLMSLQAFRLQVAEVAVASKPELAYDLLVFSGAVSLLGDSYRAHGLDINFHDKSPIMGKVKDTPAAKALASLKEKLPLKWLDIEDETKQFEAFRKLSDLQKQFILAHCVALTLEPNFAPQPGAAITAYDSTLVLTGIKVESYWRPTADNYLSRLTRDQLLDLGRKLFGHQWAKNSANDKKGALVSTLHNAFADPEKAVQDKEGREILKTWLPEGMSFACREKKPAKAKKKAA